MKGRLLFKRVDCTEAVTMCLCFSNIFISDTADGNDFQQIVNATVILRNSTAGPDSCFRIVIINDTDPERAENFTLSFMVNRTQPEGVSISINQSEAVIIIPENDCKSYCCSSWMK